MRVGYFITRFPYKESIFEKYRWGGAENVAYHLSKYIASRGHIVKVFTTSATSCNLLEKENGLEIYRFSTRLNIENGSVSVRMFFDCIKHSLDIVHVHFATPAADLAGLWYKKIKKVPLIVTYHGDGLENYGKLIRRMAVYVYNRIFVNRILSEADVIISPSEYYIDESRFLGRYREKIEIIPNGINLKDFEIGKSKEECRELLGLDKGKEIILFVGALINYKAPDVLLRSMPAVLEEHPNSELVLVGTGPMKKELEEISRRLGIEKSVRFAGFVDEHLKPFYYRAADIFCLPSTMTTEVFPLVLLEASASELPIVVSDLKTFKCIIEDGYNSIVTRRGDPKALADAIIYLLENEDVRKKMGENARRKVENYSWERIAERHEKLYERVLNENLPFRRI
ncbi:MAG: glycosyltransferase family 1 protein [Archaeoglobi archaeon]|nr:MAG: glycosyltransferase family 1 protein [Archaeoglobi archaeon]